MQTQEEQLYTTSKPHARTWIAATAAAVLLLALPSVLPPDAEPHAGQFLGRFHVSLIHIPIGLLLLAPVFDYAAKKRPALTQAASLTLNIAAVTAFLTAFLGIVLAHAGAFPAEQVNLHLWSGVILAVAAIAIALFRPMLPQRASLTLPLALLTIWTAHTGGNIVYGSGWLTESLPSISGLFGPSRNYPTVDPNGTYATKVQPILNANCVKCHGPSDRKGNLRLDSYAHLMDGGASGNIVAPGHSILLQRITLPADDPKLMPKKGAPLTPEEIKVLQDWVTAGALPTDAPATSKP